MGPEMRDKVLAELRKVVVEKDREARLLLTALLAGGHVLLEGVPGVSKTLLTKSFAKCMELDFGRVQFTPDMLPLDIVGGFIFNMKERELEFRKGPAFTNILLADEINRAPPKVQSALLEAMQEGQVTIEGRTEALPSPNMVIATQNPIEFQGVYPLPEGQLDRFMLKVTMSYPSVGTESAVIRRNISGDDFPGITGVVSRGELAEAFAVVKHVKVSEEMLDYLARLAAETRTDVRVLLGASPRAIIQLAACAKASAYLSGRDYIVPDDVKDLAVDALSHRVKLKQSSTITGEATSTSAVIHEIIEKVKPPR
ncbi:MAG: MoxR family ATPase [Thaumarchaeota archaeon]|nr:MoxR family ATPase [Nitrososphaerota archaeon]